MIINIPKLALVTLIGPSGAGKTTFAHRHFKSTEIISSDRCRAMLSDDENDMQVTKDAFELVHFVAAKRLTLERLAVIDATNVRREDRAPLVALARKHHVLPVAIVLNPSEGVLRHRNKKRTDREMPHHVVRTQRSAMRRSIRGLKREGFRHVFVLNSEEAIEEATIQRHPLWNDRREETGPFDIIGDVHGCADELEALLTTLGYERYTKPGLPYPVGYRHPEQRRVIFLGDLVDRGPRVIDTLSIAMNMVADGHALCVPGNHENKLKRWLKGKNPALNHGLETTTSAIEALPDGERDAFKDALLTFIDGLISHYVFDGGKLVCAHAGLKEKMQGRASGRVREFAMYGDTTGETDEFGLPVRHNWAAEYRGRALVVYGHTPVPEALFIGRTVNIDTGCVFGGELTAFQYPEHTTVSETAAKVYVEPVKPIAPVTNERSVADDILDIDDVLGKRVINTGIRKVVTIRAAHAAAALETISRQGVNPKWLVYLPPTMSPCDTSAHPEFLERPEEAFDYFKYRGIEEVVCQEKHMGSRAVMVLCQSETVAQKRFGITGEGAGMIYTRLGRRFTDNDILFKQLLDRVRDAMTKADLWNTLQTDWICLDCEIMPWSLKASSLLKEQYTATGAAAEGSLEAVIAQLQKTAARDDLMADWKPQNEQESALPANASELLERYQDKQRMAAQYRSAYRQYCWPASTIDDIKLAPFHIMATEGAVHTDKDHRWHLETIAKIADADPGLIMKTAHRFIELTDETAVQNGIAWWESLTEKGGEGMVVKPMQFVPNDGVQPAVKVRGREYLRIIYGPEYTAPDQLQRLKARYLRHKRSLALREFALGIEALHRFVDRAPLCRMHETVFGVLALESEPTDPRL